MSTRIAAARLRPLFGLTPMEWRVLATLNTNGATPISALARHGSVLKSQMTRVITSLEQRKLIDRQANPADGRSSLVVLSAQGRSLAEEVMLEAMDRNERMLDRLNTKERAELRRLLSLVQATSSTFYNTLKSTSDSPEPDEPEAG